jgi:hypothetical protein
VGTVSKSVGSRGGKRLGQGLWTAVAAGVGFPVHRAAVSTGRGRGEVFLLLKGSDVSDRSGWPSHPILSPMNLLCRLLKFFQTTS